MGILPVSILEAANAASLDGFALSRPDPSARGVLSRFFFAFRVCRSVFVCFSRSHLSGTLRVHAQRAQHAQHARIGMDDRSDLVAAT